MEINRFQLLKGPAGFVACAALFGGTVWSLTKVAQGHPICGFRLLTGLPCPGCGGTRAMLDLYHGQIHEAFLANTYGIILVFTVVILWTRWTILRLMGKNVPIATFSKPVAYGFAMVTLVWTVFRWTPWGHFLYPYSS